MVCSIHVNEIEINYYDIFPASFQNYLSFILKVTVLIFVEMISILSSRCAVLLALH